MPTRDSPRIVVASLIDAHATPIENEVRVCVIPLTAPPAEVDELLGCLTEEERERAARYKLEKPRHQFVTGRGLLRQILGHRLGVEPRRVPITYTGAGKPILATGDIHFNVSHTDELALIGFANCPVGIDIERVRTLANPDALVERFFSAVECTAYRALASELQPNGFFRGWVCKEAVIKAAGLSVTCLGEFDVELHPERPAALLGNRHPALATHDWQLTAWEPAAGFMAAAALATS